MFKLSSWFPLCRSSFHFTQTNNWLSQLPWKGTSLNLDGSRRATWNHCHRYWCTMHVKRGVFSRAQPMTSLSEAATVRENWIPSEMTPEERVKLEILPTRNSQAINPVERKGRRGNKKSLQDGLSSIQTMSRWPLTTARLFGTNWYCQGRVQ